MKAGEMRCGLWRNRRGVGCRSITGGETYKRYPRMKEEQTQKSAKSEVSIDRNSKREIKWRQSLSKIQATRRSTRAGRGERG